MPQNHGPHPQQKASGPDTRVNPAVTIIVPAYKEEEHIESTLQNIAATLRASQIKSEIVAVIDIVPGDSTNLKVRNVAQRYHEVRTVERWGRRGVGDAVRTGIRTARGAIIVIAMGDQSEDASDIVRLVDRAQGHDIVFTNRFRHGRPPGYPVIKYLANRCCNLAASLLLGIPYPDTTNAFKAYRKVVLDRIDLSSDSFEIFLEMPLKAMTLPSIRTDEIEIVHTVRKKAVPKLSVLKDGYRYASIIVSLSSRRHRIPGAAKKTTDEQLTNE